MQQKAIQKVTPASAPIAARPVFISVSTISHRSGSEGPAHDRFAYEEWTLARGADTWQIHDGLARWVKFNRKLCPLPMGDEELGDVLKAAGCPLTLPQICKIYRRIRARPAQLHKAHGAPRSVEGFPGETLLICPCGQVLDCEFDESAII